MPLSLQPGTLWDKTLEVSDKALRIGALQPIPTEYEFVEQDDVRFLVRIVSNLHRKGDSDKMQARKADIGEDFNPFLPYDEDLFVADISDTHLCVLNKFNIVDHHLLIITREFEEQDSLLTLQDFEAMWSCLREFDGLAFYNSGKIAGASQSHKHLQYVPLPLVPGEQGTPMDSAIALAEFDGPIGISSRLPFAHAIARLDRLTEKPITEAARETLLLYENMLRTLGLLRHEGGHPRPYNLLATRQWMMMVPRTQERFASMSVNAMGFAGAFLVKDRETADVLRGVGFMNVLRETSGHAS